MKIILIGNYPLDHQESMQRFANMLREGFESNGFETEIWKPVVFFGIFFSITNSGLGKWFGYLDKYLLFPFVLKVRLNKKEYKNVDVKFHICDHSNAPYLNYLPKDRTGITCHDVLAIRGSMGFADAYAPASKTGMVLQKWISNNLSKAKTLAAVSKFTFSQLNEINPKQSNQNWVVIYNAFNAPFKPMERGQSVTILEQMGMSVKDSFILHVGSGELRKNRKLLLHMVHRLGDKWEGKICFAGKPLEDDMIKLAESLNIINRVVSIVKPNHEQLMALYSTCEAFVFPSFSEGFGWPLIEAQACGAPVITSCLEPMIEVSGTHALYSHPEDVDGFTNAFLSLQNSTVRERIINSGYINIERFRISKMMDDYIDLHDIKRN